MSGSIILGKIWNVDIRDKGSKSAGGTNALRVVGKTFALLTVLIDISKGIIAVLLISQLKFYSSIPSNLSEYITILCGLAAVLGQKLSAETAEAKTIDRSQGDSTMQVVAQQMQDMIDNSLLFHARYLGSNESGSSFVNRDFLASRLDPQEIGSLLQLFTAGTITQETLLKQLHEGGLLVIPTQNDEPNVEFKSRN